MSTLSSLFSNHRRRQQIIADLRPKLYRVALGWCSNPALADDLVQETTFKALKSLSKLEKSEALEGWLFKIMTNCFRDHCRKAETQELAEELIDETLSRPEDEIDNSQLVQQVRTAVGELKESYREVLVLVDLGGFSYSETAEILALPIGTVMSRLNRARQQLKQALLSNPVVSSHNVSYLERVK